MYLFIVIKQGILCCIQIRLVSRKLLFLICLVIESLLLGFQWWNLKLFTLAQWSRRGLWLIGSLLILLSSIYLSMSLKLLLLLYLSMLRWNCISNICFLGSFVRTILLIILWKHFNNFFIITPFTKALTLFTGTGLSIIMIIFRKLLIRLWIVSL